MKSHFDPNDRPIQGPSNDDPQEPYLAEQDLPQDSFSLEDDTHSESQNNNLEPMVITPQESHDDATSDPDPFAAPDVCQMHAMHECILKMRESNGKREYLIKWQGYSTQLETWEPEGNIFNLQLLDDFHNRNASATAI